MIVIEEASQLPIVSMPDIVLENARELDAEAREIRRGERDINGVRVTLLEYSAVTEGIAVTFLGHFLSNAAGTVQIIDFSTSNIFGSAREKIERFASGFVLTPQGGAAPSANLATFPEGRSAGELQAQFGLIGVDANGDPTFAQTRTVPNTVGQSYGWFIEVGALSEPISWIEEVTLPEAPVSWGAAEGQPNVSVSRNRRTITIRDEGEATEGYIYKVWEVGEGDPSGPHLMRVTLSDGRSAEFFLLLSRCR